MKLKSHAKINLFLEIIGKRNDGYHEIETLFQMIDLHDEIIIEEDDEIFVECNYPELCGENNLAYKSAQILRKTAMIKNGARINIRKRIPIASGLGGGSSNAATILVGLAKLWKLNISFDDLLKIAKEVGADVPFFLYGGCCVGRGRGDILTPVIPFWKEKGLKLILILPDFPVRSGDIYSKIADTSWGRRSLNLSSFNWEEILFNRLEEVVTKEYHIIAEIKKSLSMQGVVHNLVSGSGPVVFGIIGGDGFTEINIGYRCIEATAIFP